MSLSRLAARQVGSVMMVGTTTRRTPAGSSSSSSTCFVLSTTTRGSTALLASCFSPQHHHDQRDSSSSSSSSSNSAGLTFHLSSSSSTSSRWRIWDGSSSLHHQQSATSQQAGGHASRCPGFASITTSQNQIGQLRWNHTGSAQQAAGSTSVQQQPQQQPQQQQQAGGRDPQQQQQQAAGLTAEQLQRDLHRLATDVFRKGQVLGGGRYQLQDKIAITEGLAEGRFTTIWHGKDLNSGTDVVLKCMEAGDANSYTAGMREAALHATVGRHPNIVALLDAFEHRSSSGRHPVMVLERCGSSLLNVVSQYLSLEGVRRSTGINNPLALKHLARDTLAALDHMHRHGLAHMDLSPDNVLCDKVFVPTIQVQIQALLPQDSFLKYWLTVGKLRLLGLLRAVNLVNAQQADKIFQPMKQKMLAAVENLQGHHEGTLHSAIWRLTDFGRAVPFKGLLPGLPPGAAAGASAEAQQLLQHAPKRYNEDGVVVFSDPAYQPPEEILGMSYIGPSYDMWKLGCLLYEATTDKKLFDDRATLRLAMAKQGKTGYSDQHLFLDRMVTVLGNIPREFARKSPLHEDFFLGKSSAALGDMLRIHTVALSPTPGSHSLESLLLGHLPDQEVQEFVSFLSPLFRWDPAKRPSAAEMLQHPWLQGLDDKQQQQH